MNDQESLNLRLLIEWRRFSTPQDGLSRDLTDEKDVVHFKGFYRKAGNAYNNMLYGIELKISRWKFTFQDFFKNNVECLSGRKYWDERNVDAVRNNGNKVVNISGNYRTFSANSGENNSMINVSDHLNVDSVIQKKKDFFIQNPYRSKSQSTLVFFFEIIQYFKTGQRYQHIYQGVEYENMDHFIIIKQKIGNDEI